MQRSETKKMIDIPVRNMTATPAEALARKNIGLLVTEIIFNICLSLPNLSFSNTHTLNAFP